MRTEAALAVRAGRAALVVTLVVRAETAETLVEMASPEAVPMVAVQRGKTLGTGQSGLPSQRHSCAHRLQYELRWS